MTYSYVVVFKYILHFTLELKGFEVWLWWVLHLSAPGTILFMGQINKPWAHHWTAAGRVMGQHRKWFYSATHEHAHIHMNTHPHTHFAVDLCTVGTYDFICYIYCFLCYPLSVMHNMLYKMFCRLNLPAVLIFLYPFFILNLLHF